MHSFSFIFVAFTEVIVRRILIINNAMKVSGDQAGPSKENENEGENNSRIKLKFQF